MVIFNMSIVPQELRGERRWPQGEGPHPAQQGDGQEVRGHWGVHH